MKLYTVTIRGYKYYFSGNLSPDAIRASEDFCHKLETNGKSVNTNILFERLIRYISSDLGISVTQVNIEHIFRVNY